MSKCKHGSIRDYCVHCLKSRVAYLENKLLEIRSIQVNAFWYYSDDDLEGVKDE